MKRIASRTLLQRTLVVLFLTLTFAPIARSAAAEPKRYQGTVVDEDGKPVAGALVWYRYAFAKKGYRRAEASATSDESGRYILEIPAKLRDDEVPSASSAIWAYSPKYCIGFSRPVAKPKNPDDNQIVLGPTTDTSFVVLDPDGEPVEGALVETVNYRNHQGYGLIPQQAVPLLAKRTDAEGRVRMPSMARDRLFLIQVKSEAFGVQTQQLKVHPDAPAERTIQLRPVCRIQGQITAENPEWARFVTVTVTTEKRGGGHLSTSGKANVVTDASGFYVIPNIADGRIQMFEITVDEDLPVRPKLPDFRSRELTTDAAAIVNIPLIDLVDIRGSIVKDDTGEPLPNIEIHVYYGKDRQGTDVVSDENGEFTARVLPGKVRFQPQTLSRTKYVQLGSPKSFDVPENPEDFVAPPIRPVLTEPVDGTLLDQNDEPVADARVIAYYNNWLCSFAKTDEKGKFRLSKMPVKVNPSDASYRVVLGVGETRFMGDGGVAIVDGEPLKIRVKR